MSSINKDNIVENAARIAVVAHFGQKRKGKDNIPYIIHPLMVALKLQKFDFSEDVIAGALCHDILEDTDYPPALLQKEIGDKAFEIVKTVSYNSALKWQDKKQAYLESVRNGPVGAKAVSVADKIHNLESLFIAYDGQGPSIWQEFKRGKEEKIKFEESLLKMFKESWDHPLINEFEKLIEKEKSLQ